MKRVCPRTMSITDWVYTARSVTKFFSNKSKHNKKIVRVHDYWATFFSRNISGVDTSKLVEAQSTRLGVRRTILTCTVGTKCHDHRVVSLEVSS